ncbi:Exopolysaccharide production protein ExoZ [Polaromonas sp. CG9_12]|nr:Exopolysaccharide production protein ExoZ [Polaromonas sp. CG9_12]
MPAKQFIGVQILRFIAAMLVVVMHTTEAISVRITGEGPDHYWTGGAIGVDIFFVISGFVMAMSTARLPSGNQTQFQAAWIFLKRRLLRVAPLYWFYTLLKAALVLILPSLALRSSIDTGHLFASLFFIPAISPWGLVQPTLPVGWTLNFEMLFYLVFAIGIAWGVARIKFCFFVFLLVFVAAQLFPESVALNFYGKSLLFEFILGMGIAHVYLNYPPVSPKMGLLAAIVGTTLILGINWGDPILGFSTWEAGAGFTVLVAVWLEPWIARLRLASRLSFLGDSSYSIYLSHTFAVPFGVLMLKKLGFQESLLIIPIICLLVIACGCISYLLIESPMTNFLKRAFFKRPSFSL